MKANISNVCYLRILIMYLLIINETVSSSLSFNQLTFSSCATWISQGFTFADNTSIGTLPTTVFVTVNNSVYIAANTFHRIIMWTEGNSIPVRTFEGNLWNPHGLFVSINGDVYADNGYAFSRIDKWIWNDTNSTTVMNVFNQSSCYSIFIDINNTLYCSAGAKHVVISQTLYSTVTSFTVVAGNGSAGSLSDTLSLPYGIFVDHNLSLFVADSGNHRIQQFQKGSLNGTTVAGTLDTILLNTPKAVILDADGYLFIADSGNYRIIGSSFNGFRCIVGCTGTSGNDSDQFSEPWSISFDSYGNLYVTDRSNNRIQKFLLDYNTCGRSSNQPKLYSSTTWNPNATTITNDSFAGQYPHYIFVDLSNILYIAARSLGRVYVWPEGFTMPTRTLSNQLATPLGIFVARNSDIYVDNNFNIHRVDKWTVNATNSTVAMYGSSRCYGIFIDFIDNLYCSADTNHIVIMRPLKSNVNTSIIIAGNGTSGNTLYQLNQPRGIATDLDLNLYVADCSNNRIQVFPWNQRNGKTLAINGSNGTFSLNCPTALILDNDRYIFLADFYNNRILGSDANGFRCVVGYTGSYGSSSSELNLPHGIAFDSYGNLFVVDLNNHRIQKFFLMTNSSISQLRTLSTESTHHLETSITPFVYQSFTLPYSPFSCADRTSIGSFCNISALSCDILKPCQNNGICISNNITLYEYNCSCPLGFNGTQCQYNNRPCQANTCWNNGRCNETSNTTFLCECTPGWIGSRCQTKINYCENVTCLNNGICQSLLLNYTCECLGDSYFGRFCESQTNRIKTLKTISKSFTFIAIIAILSVILFVVILDVLKYFFGIDPVKPTQNISKKIKQPKTIQRFVYIPYPSHTQISKRLTTISETISS